MKIRDLKTQAENTFRDVQCKLIGSVKILAVSGHIEFSGENKYKFVSADQTFLFSIEEERIAKQVKDYLYRKYSNLAQVIVGGENGTFSLYICFFNHMERWGKLSFILQEDVQKQLRKKGLLTDKKDIQGQIKDNFEMSDGIEFCIAYTSGNYFSEEADPDSDRVDEDDDWFYDEDEEESSSSEEKQMQGAASKCIKIYGRDYALQLRQGQNQYEEMLVAEKLDTSRRDVPSMALAMGGLDITDSQTYMSSKVKELLSDKSGYLELWNRYAALEGDLLLKRARNIGLLQIDKGSVSIEGDNLIINLKSGQDNKLQYLNKGDSLLFSKNVPLYLQDEIMTWQEYRSLKYGPSENTKGGLQNGSRDVRVEIKEIYPWGLTVENKGISGEYVSLSIEGDEQQIIRRENARIMIENGESANPVLGLLIEGRSAAGLTQCWPDSRLAPLSDFVKKKIFKNEPTQTQLDAISIALNTPDIAVIQGPPGTGKTTVITAIIERLNELADKNTVNKGQVLVTSFQHDAVRNVIDRLSINSLPTIKFGKKDDEDDTMERKLEAWCQTVTDKLLEKNPALRGNAVKQKLLELYNFYYSSPSRETGLAFLEYAKKINDDGTINQKIELLLEEFRIHSQEEDTGEELLRKVRRLRVTPEGFCDHGSDAAYEVMDRIENFIDKGNAENIFIMDTLRQASNWGTAEASAELLDKLTKAKRLLLEKIIPQPIYRVEKPRKEITQIYEEIRGRLRNPQNEVEEILYELLNELENNPIAVKKVVENYNFVFAATTQQSEGKDIKAAKEVRRGEHAVYDTVVVDEAARVNPGDLMVPMAQARRRIILVGDHRQLPHIYNEEVIESLNADNLIDQENNIETTLFQYLMQNARKMSEEDGIPRTITLDKQYRMHPMLGEFVNNNFYKKYGEGFSSPLGAEYFEQPFYEKPLVWVDMKHSCGGEMMRGTSRVRLCEAEYIAKVVRKFKASEKGKKLNYGVISFYSAQVKEIQRQLGDLKKEVRVGSVDAFQGMEFDVIFLSIVRTNNQVPKFLDMERLRGSEAGGEEKTEETKNYREHVGRKIYGFLTSPNRLCVALSRQKKLLIVVGNSDIFHTGNWAVIAEKCIPAMKNLYELCTAEGVIIDGAAESV